MATNPVNLAFGRAVAVRRDELGLTQAALAGLVGMSRASIANIEKGRQNVLLHHVYDLAEALEMKKVGDLLPTRSKAGSGGQLHVTISGSNVSAREVAQANDLVAAALASVEGRKAAS